DAKARQPPKGIVHVLATDWIQKELDLITLPDITGEIDISIFGSVDYTLTGIRIVKWDLPEPSVQFYPDATGFKASISGLNAVLSGGWMMDYGIISQSGSFDLAASMVDVTSVVELGKDAGGRLSVSSGSCNAKIGDVDIALYGGASEILQFFVDNFKGDIITTIENRICPGVQTLIGNLESHLQAMNVSFDVDQILTLDLPLSDLPVIKASSLNLGLKGEFFGIRTHKDPPFEAKPFTVPEQPGYMLSVGLSEFTLNSALYGCYSDGLLQAIINDSMVPPFSPVHLNTSSMGIFIPQLPKMFPGLLMTLQVYAKKEPLFSLQPDAVKLGVQGAVKAFAIQPNSTLTPLFTLNVNSNFSSKVWISDGRLKGSVTMDNFTLTLAASEVGTFQVHGNKHYSAFYVSRLLLAKGVILPRMKQAQLVNSVLKGFIAMSSDATVFLTDRDFD
uniref:Bactericidal permeability-increasing protein n=1 Tax=Monopterus albus TaxID=43700 RepID=A0A3Q3Q580_MONAL